MSALCRHIPRLHDYLWVAEDGMKMQGYNGSQLWDTAFTVQAYISTGLHSDVSDSVRAAHTYIKNSQIIEEAEQPLSRNYRHVSKGAWPFSTRDHGWPISDCTGEESCPQSCHVSVHCTVVLISHAIWCTAMLQSSQAGDKALGLCRVIVTTSTSFLPLYACTCTSGQAQGCKTDW